MFYSSPIGQNLYWTSGRAPNATTGTELWVDTEIDHYHYDTNTCDPNEMCGHYTQVYQIIRSLFKCKFVLFSSVAYLGEFDLLVRWRYHFYHSRIVFHVTRICTNFAERGASLSDNVQPGSKLIFREEGGTTSPGDLGPISFGTRGI